jgi:hypothetical protein
MARGQHGKLVKERADRILDSALTARAYAIHFETQLRRGRIRRLLYIGYLQFSRAGALAAGLDPGESR